MPLILSTTLVLGSTMTVGFVGSSLVQREAWSVQYAAEAPAPAGAAFGVPPVAYEPPTEDVQLDRVVQMLDRSDEHLASDAVVSDVVLQARSELGMLLATYQAQQAVAEGGAAGPEEGAPSGDLGGFSIDGPSPRPAPLSPLVPAAPAAPAAPPVAPAEPGASVPPVDAAASAAAGAAAAANTFAAPGTTQEPGATDANMQDPAATSGAVDTTSQPPPEGGAAPEDAVGVTPDVPVEPLDPTDEDAPAHDDVVTISDIVLAATQLAELMGPSYALAAVGVVPANGVVPESGSLADQLAAAVALYAGSTSQYANGMLPDSALCTLGFDPRHSLRCDAAVQLDALAAEYQKEFGKPLRISDSYRSYDAQVAVKAVKPYLAAVPGTSQHGWGLAIDVGSPVSTGTSPEYAWMRLHAPDYGWDNPSWARLDGRKPEPWHFEFYAAGAMPDRYTPGAEGTPTAPPVPGQQPTPPVTPPPTTPPVPVPTPTPVPPTPTPTEPPPTPTPTDPPTDPPTTPTDPTPSPTDPPTTPTAPPTTPTTPPTEAPTASPSPTDPASPTNIPSLLPDAPTG